MHPELNKIDIKLSFKNGFEFTVTVTDPKKMLRVIRWDHISDVFVQMMENYMNFRRKRNV